MSSDDYATLAGLFHPGAVAEDTLALNHAMAQMPGLPLDIGAIRAAIATQMAASTPEGTLYQSPRAEVVDVPDSSASVRLLRPEGRSTGVCVHVHGGGWSFGAANEHDRDLEILADELEVTVASVEYRLAPEHPFPAPGNDVFDAISFVMSQRSELVGDDASSELLPVVVVGESAGANLVLSAVCRMRDVAEPLPAGLVLFYGAYDLSMTPSQSQYGSAGLVNTDSLAYFYSLYAPGHDLRDPRISPLFALLAGLPPDSAARRDRRPSR